MFVDLDEGKLWEYRSAQVNPTDFDAFWEGTLADARKHDLDVAVVPVSTALATVDVFDVTFSGFEGQPIRAWLKLPRGVDGPLPGIVQFVGYGGGRGHCLENLLWSSAGFAHLVMDTRGQGAAWGRGDTPDPVGSGPAVSGVMTRGIERRETYYYRRVFVDAVRAVETMKAHPAVDAARVAVVGASQGGGIALAAAGLVPDLAAVVAHVPFLCDFPRATVITDNAPYREIGTYLATHRDAIESVHATLSYFDGVNFARRCQAPAWFSAALMDSTCPPSTVFAAFHEYAGEKELRVWPYNGHEGGGIEDEARAVDTLQRLLAGEMR